MPKKILVDENETAHNVFLNTKHYCPLLWNHLHINTMGDVQPCCMAPFGSSLGNINEKSFDEIWNGQPMKDARKKLLDDLPLDTCKDCYEKEKSSNWSLRKASISKYHESIIPLLKTTDEDGGSYDSKPVYWDIRFSNICNMRCRMCGHFSSSKWFNDAQRLSQEYGNKNYLGHQKDRAIIFGVEDSTALLDRLDEYLPYVQELYFAGGEPMIMEEHYRILERLNDLGLHDIYIRYNTNFLQLYYKDKNIVDLWKRFSNVFCSISVDTYGKRAEILRKDTVWETIENNVEFVKQNAPRVKINIAPTIQILNVFSVTDLHQQWCTNGWIGPNDMFLNILHGPDFYCIKALPLHLKLKAEQKLRSHLDWLQTNYKDNLYSVTNTITNSIDFMMSEQLDDRLMRKLVEHTRQLDTIRQENTPETFPELEYIWNNYS